MSSQKKEEEIKVKPLFDDKNQEPEQSPTKVVNETDKTKTETNVQGQSDQSKTQETKTEVKNREVNQTASAQSSVTKTQTTTTTKTVKRVVKSIFSEEQKLFILNIKKEISELLASERQYFDMEEGFLCLEAEFKREQQELEMAQSEFQCRHETDINIIESLQREIDDQRNILQDKKEQNINLEEEHSAQKTQLESRRKEISKYKAEMEQQKIISEQLLTTCNKYKSEYTEITTKCDDEGNELEQILYDQDTKEKETLEINAQVESCEYQIELQSEEIEKLNSIIEEKNEVQLQKDEDLEEAEASIIKVKEQITSFEEELNHLKQVEEKLLMENSDIQKRCKGETTKNEEITRNMYELKSKIHKTESEIKFNQRELENITSSNEQLEKKMEMMKSEIKESKEHINVITAQNKELTSELKEFEKQSEEVREKLDNKKADVQRISEKTQEIKKSTSAQNIMKTREFKTEKQTASFGGDISPIQPRATQSSIQMSQPRNVSNLSQKMTIQSSGGGNVRSQQAFGRKRLSYEAGPAVQQRFIEAPPMQVHQQQQRVVQRQVQVQQRPVQVQREQVFLEARTREQAEQISPTRVRQVIVSPVREHREQYRIAPAEEHYIQYVHGEGQYEDEMARGGAVQQEHIGQAYGQQEMVGSGLVGASSYSRTVTRTVQSKPQRMSYSEAKEHFAKNKSINKTVTTFTTRTEDGPQ